MTMHKVFHPREDIDRVYVLRKKGRGLTSIEDSVNTLDQTLEDNIKRTKKYHILTLHRVVNQEMHLCK